MDWKPYYRGEIESMSGRETVETLLRGAVPGAIDELLIGEAIVSFPHTALRYAGPLQARVVRMIYRLGIERVIALGVLHGSSVAVYKKASDAKAPTEQRRAACDAVSGGFLLPSESIVTPSGDLPIDPAVPSEEVPVRVDSAGILTDKFSLDTFFALMRREADRCGVSPIPVFPIFIGLTRDPIDRSFDVARRIGEWVRSIACETHGGPATAVVATGDLVHYGTAYGTSDATPAEPLPEIERRFRREVDRVLSAALTERDWELAYRLSHDMLHNDQREISAVISEVLGSATHGVLHFELSDYAKILDTAPPCLVASALIAYIRSEADGVGR